MEATPDGEPEPINGRYRLIEAIGQGGMGTVWRGHDEMLDREVAIKRVLFPPDVDDDERAELTALALREARATARLNHPGVVTIYDVIDDGSPVIVMELIEGRSLADILREEVRLPYRRVAEIGAAVLDALREAHAAGIVHRDLKPANILITDRRIVLTDFGVAQRVGERAEDFDDVLGTPAFMAPEQAENAAASPAADLWSLGAVLFNAVEGRPPFQGPDHATVLLTLLTQEAPALVNGGPLKSLIAALLVKDPERRPTTEETAARLEAVLRQDDGTRVAPARPALPPPESGKDSGTSAGTPSPGKPVIPPGSGAPAPVNPATPPTAMGTGAATPAGPPSAPKPTTRPRAVPHHARPDGTLPHSPARPTPTGLQRVGRAAAGMVVTVLVITLLYSTHFSKGGTSGVDAGPPDIPSAVPSSPSTSASPERAAIDATAISPAGDLVAYGDDSGEVRVYDTDSHKSRGSFNAAPYGDDDGVTALAFSPDGRSLAIGLDDGEVDIWDVARRQRWKLDDFDHRIGALGFSSDGRRLTAVSDIGLVGVWTVRTRKLEANQMPLSNNHCSAMALSADTAEAACATDDGAVIVWDAEKAETVSRWPAGDQVDGLALSPDGETLAVATHSGEGDSHVRVWKVSSQRTLDDLDSAAGSAPAFSPDGRTLAFPAYSVDSGREDIELWKVAGGTKTATLKTDASEVGAVVIGPDDRLLAFADSDGAKLWNTRSKESVAFWYG